MSKSEEVRKDTLRTRLEACADTLAAGGILEVEDSQWVATLLKRILAAEDIRFHFYSKTTVGRPPASESWGTWMTIEALILTETTGQKGKALWAVLGEKWGFSDGSVKNAISRNREVAKIILDSMQRTEALRKIEAISREHKNSSK